MGCHMSWKPADRQVVLEPLPVCNNCAFLTRRSKLLLTPLRSTSRCFDRAEAGTSMRIWHRQLPYFTAARRHSRQMALEATSPSALERSEA